MDEINESRGTHDQFYFVSFPTVSGDMQTIKRSFACPLDDFDREALALIAWGVGGHARLEIVKVYVDDIGETHHNLVDIKSVLREANLDCNQINM
jgi:hypothetical protein